MYGAIDQMPNVLKKRVVKTQKKSRSRSGARTETTSWILTASTIVTVAAPTPNAATTNHQKGAGASNTQFRAPQATANAARAMPTLVGAGPRHAEPIRWTGLPRHAAG